MHDQLLFVVIVTGKELYLASRSELLGVLNQID